MLNYSRDKQAESRSVKVWDGPVRLFHWLLVPLICFSWWSGEEHYMEWHRLSGYAILALLVFRIFWGLAGSRTARFGQFLRGPAAVAAYARTLTARDKTEADGHNPLGGWSVALMLLALVAMVVAGLFAVDIDGFESGPLAVFVSFDQGRAAAEWHETIFNVILALVALHLAAILFYLIWKRQNLISAMIHGRRKANASEQVAPVTYPIWKAGLGIAIAALSVYAVAQSFRF